MQRSNEPFLKHLNVRRTPYVIATAEDEEFDEIFLQELRDEGFEVHYLAMGEDTGARFASRLHALADQITGISDRYAIVGTSSLHLNVHAPCERCKRVLIDMISIR